MLGQKAAQRFVLPFHLSYWMPDVNVGLFEGLRQCGAPLQALAAQEVLEEVCSSGSHLQRATRAVFNLGILQSARTQ